MSARRRARPAVITVLDLLADAATGPGVLHFLSDGDCVSIAELWRSALGVAGQLHRRAGGGVAIGIVLSNTKPAVVGLVAIWASGNTVVSLPHRAPGQSRDAWLCQLRDMCVLASVELLLVPNQALPELSAFERPVVGYDGLSDHHAHVASGGSADLIQFTSGSTSSPTGVWLSGAAVAANLLAIQAVTCFGDGDLTMSWLPLSHDMGLVGMLLAPLIASAPRFGARGAALLRPEQFIRDPARWLRSCAEMGATATTVPNFALDLATRAAPRLAGVDLSALRLCIVGAEPVNADSLRAFTATFRDAGLRESIMSPAYGLAENVLAVTMVRPDEPWRSIHRVPLGLDGPAEFVSNGRPLRGVEVRLRRTGHEFGEIEIRSPSLLTRYLGDAAAHDDGWLRTKDIGALDNGELFVFGRADDALNIGGRLVFPLDLERAAEAWEQRRLRCAAVPWGTGFALVVEVTPGDANPRTASAIARAVLRSTGTGPRALLLVARNALPRTTSGKIRRHAVTRKIMDETLRVLCRVGDKD